MLKLGAGLAAVLVAGPRFARAQSAKADLVLVNMADLHSAYDRYPAILTLVDRLKAEYAGVPLVTLLNGDLFELGNVVALRSLGLADWAFLQALRSRGPVILNLGNHEGAFMDQADAVRRARALGVTVLSSIVDRRSGSLFAPAFTRIAVGERVVPVVGLSVNALNTYRAAIRPTLAVAEPVSYFKALYPVLAGDSPFSVVMSHAGVQADREILSGVRDGTLVVGGHDHLNLSIRQGRTLYKHNGFKGEFVNVVAVRFGAAGAELESRDLPVSPDLPAQAMLAGVISSLRRRHLQPEDLAPIGRADRDYTVTEAAFWAAGELRKATGADLACMNHTSFGSGLAAGPVPKYRFDEFLRFENDVVRTQMDAEGVRTLLNLSNKQSESDLSRLRGDFMYTTPVNLEAGRTYTVATTSFPALPANQNQYFGRTGLNFEAVPNLKSKALLAAALARNS